MSMFCQYLKLFIFLTSTPSNPSPVNPVDTAIGIEHLEDKIPAIGGEIFKILLALVALIVAIFVMIWILKRMNQGQFSYGSSHKSIKILEKRPLSQKTMLYLIEVDGKQILIGESQLELKNLAQVNTISHEKIERL